MNAATEVFNIPELLEMILLSLPRDTSHAQIGSMRTIHLARTTSPTWHSLIQSSTLIRQMLYLPTCLDTTDARAWTETRTSFPPAEPNPWIPHLLLRQRSWGSAWPFDLPSTALYEDGLTPSRPRFWTFALELSRAQYARLPAAGAWRELLATSPPFTDFWYTRAFYELGSGRAPFVTHIDYDPKFPKTEQKFRGHRGEGVTLGDIVDAFSELFERDSRTKFVMVESVRRPIGRETAVVGEEEGPRTRLHYPGTSAEKWHGWHG